MPWKETTPVDQRMHFVAALSTCRWTMSELCRLYGISRKTGYKWATRYGQQGIDGCRPAFPRKCPVLARRGMNRNWFHPGVDSFFGASMAPTTSCR
jgi:hypothetical protein